MDSDASVSEEDDSFQSEEAKRSIFITGFHPETSIEELEIYFSRYGDVEFASVKNTYGIIRFKVEEAALETIKEKYHKLKGCKIVADVYCQKTKNQFLVKHIDIEEPDDYLSASLREELMTANDVNDQIIVISERLRLTDEDRAVRENIRSYFQDLFSQYFTYADVSIFGSTINGVGLRGCDLDLLLSLNTEQEDSDSINYPKESQPELFVTLLNLIKEKSRKIAWSELLNLTEYDVISLIGDIMTIHGDFCKDVVRISCKKCPIVHFTYDGNPAISCDLSTKNRLVVFNSRLIKLYTEIDSRVAPLLIVIRLWFICAKLQMSKMNRFSSYCNTMLVLHFLQQLSPPVIPTVEELQLTQDDPRIIAGCNCAFFEDLNEIPRHNNNNNESVTELLRGFFKYFERFDFAMWAVDAYTGKSVKVEELTNTNTNYKTKCVNVLDPFIRYFNVASNVNLALSARFKQALSITCGLCEEDNHWSERNVESSWGILSLLDNNAYDFKEVAISIGRRRPNQKYVDDFKRFRIHTHDDLTKPGKSKTIPTIEDSFKYLCRIVGRIFSKALRFNCDEMCGYTPRDEFDQHEQDKSKHDDDDDIPPGDKRRKMSGGSPLTLRSNRVRVIVNNCTWVGREAVKDFLQKNTNVNTSDSIIMNEFHISNYLIAQVKRKQSDKMLEFEFDVECTPSNDIYVNFRPIPGAEELEGQVFSFLNTYIQNLVQRLIDSCEVKNA